MNAVLTIASASLLEHSRRKLIAFFVLVSIAVTGVLLYLTRTEAGEIFFGPDNRGTLLSLGFMQFFALLATLAVSMGNIGRPFASGEALTVLARALARWQYALGRLLGSLAVVAGMCALMALELQIVQVAAGRSDPGLLWAHWAITAFNLAVVAAVTTLLSALISTPILVAIIGYFANSAIGGVRFARALVRQAHLTGLVPKMIDLLWYITPKFLNSPLERRQLTADIERVLGGGNSPGLAVWAVAYLAGLVALTLVLASRKDV